METNEPVRMSLREHFEELRWVLIRSVAGLLVMVAICWFLHNYTLKAIIWPLKQAKYGKKLKVLDPAEAIIQYLKVDIILGLLLASPWVAYQVWSFIGKGLYPHEKKNIYVYAGLSVVLFVSGVLFSYFIMLPLVLQILIGFDPSGVAEADLRFSPYINFFFKISLAMGTVFQLPVVMRFLSGIGLVEKNTWREYRKYAIVLSFVLAAIVTPADPISQIVAAIPMVLLYEIGIILIPSPDESKMDSSEKEDEASEENTD